MKTSLCLALSIVAGFGNSPLLVPSVHAAVSARVRSAEQAYGNAQAKLNTAQQNWNRTQQDLAKAVATHQAASNTVHQARLGAAQRHGAELGMTVAIAERDSASRQMKARRDALESEVRMRSDFQAAENEAAAARQRLGELSDDKSLTDEQQHKIGSELAAKIRHPTEMRKQTEGRDVEMQKASKAWQTAEKKIIELQPRLRKMIDSDPAVTKAGQSENQAAASLEKARNSAARAEQEVMNAQMALDRQNQNLQAAIAQSRRHR